MYLSLQDGESIAVMVGVITTVGIVYWQQLKSKELVSQQYFLNRRDSLLDKVTIENQEVGNLVYEIAFFVAAVETNDHGSLNVTDSIKLIRVGQEYKNAVQRLALAVIMIDAYVPMSASDKLKNLVKVNNILHERMKEIAGENLKQFFSDSGIMVSFVKWLQDEFLPLREKNYVEFLQELEDSPGIATPKAFT